MTRIVRIVAISAIALYAAGLSGIVRAGTLPDISGNWWANGDMFKTCHISQSGSSVTARNERFSSGTGYFANPSTISIDWQGERIVGHISYDLRRIDWSNGTYWTRPTYWRPPSGGEATPRPTPTPNPYRSLTHARANLESTAEVPIAVFDGFAAVKKDGTKAIVCVSFKNKRDVTATRVDFAFTLSNAKGHASETLQLQREGKFSTGIEIHGWHSLPEWQGGQGHRGYNDNCTGVNGNTPTLSLLHAEFWSYDVERVHFEDGTSWTNPNR